MDKREKIIKLLITKLPMGLTPATAIADAIMLAIGDKGEPTPPPRNWLAVDENTSEGTWCRFT